MLTHPRVQVGSMVIYILDALQHREAALLAVWLALGLMNMSFGLTALFFTDNHSILTPILTSVMNGITLFLTGEHTLSALYASVQQPRTGCNAWCLQLAWDYTCIQFVQMYR